MGGGGEPARRPDEQVLLAQVSKGGEEVKGCGSRGEEPVVAENIRRCLVAALPSRPAGLRMHLPCGAQAAFPHSARSRLTDRPALALPPAFIAPFAAAAWTCARWR